MRDGGVKGGRHREKDTQEDKTEKEEEGHLCFLWHSIGHISNPPAPPHHHHHPLPQLLLLPFPFTSPISSSPPCLFFTPPSLEKWQTRCLGRQRKGDVTVIFPPAEEQKRKGPRERERERELLSSATLNGFWCIKSLQILWQIAVDRYLVALLKAFCAVY